MASADGKNSRKCDKNFVAAVLAIIIGAIVTLATPELRNFFGLKDDEPTPVVQETPSPTEYTLAEHKRQFVAEANTNLSSAFNTVAGEAIASLIISPIGREPLPIRAVLNGRSHEFTSSAGVFIVTVLDIDWEGKTVAVQVSRKL